MVPGDRYSLAEFAYLFAKFDGTAPTLLRVLQEGQLTTVIYYPSYLPRRIEVPTSIWEEVDLDELALMFPSPLHEPQDFTISTSFLYQEERARLRQIAEAVARHDPAPIDPLYRAELEQRGLLRDRMSTEDWVQLIQLQGKWRISLYQQKSSAAAVFVTGAAWKEFFDNMPPSSVAESEAAAKKAGAPRNPYWEEILEDAAVLLMLEGRPSNATELAQKLENRVNQKYPDKKNALPKLDTIARRMSDLMRRADSVG